MKQYYTPIMTGSNYAVAVSQLEDHGAIHPYAHMFFIKTIQDEHPDVISAIMTQLSLNTGFKERGTKSHISVHSDTKQIHFRYTSKPMHLKELDNTQIKSVLESHMFLKKKKDSKIKG